MSFFFFNDTATTEIYTLSLHDALPICADAVELVLDVDDVCVGRVVREASPDRFRGRLGAREHAFDRTEQRELRSEEHTSELQSRQYLVCRLLLEKKKKHNLLYLIINIL